MWLGLGRQGGGTIDQEQLGHSWNEFVLRWQRVGAADH
jgi:hypothetical protein